MKRRLFRIGLTGGIAASAALAANLASAAPPASVRGSWVILIDQTYATLDIDQGGPGAPGAALCRVIVGSLDIAPIRGFYCPDSGRIHFLHNNVSTGATVRTFTGSVTDATASAPAQMTGTFNVLAAAFGDYGEYPFSATK
jgi:hypothetical protein